LKYKNMEKIVLVGGSGYFGQAIIRHLKDQYHFVVLTRRPIASAHPNVETIVWDPRYPEAEWHNIFEGAKAIINLAGESVNGRPTNAHRGRVLQSRLLSTQAIGEALKFVKYQPEVWINASAIALYPYTQTQDWDEDTTLRNLDFMGMVCQRWEHAFNESRPATMRGISMRISLILGEDGGVLPRLNALAKLGLGGKQGSGEQYISWIHEIDACRAVEFFLENLATEGAYNLCSPEPLPNAIFMQQLRKRHGMWFGLPTPALAMRIGGWLIGTDADLVLNSQRVVSKRLPQAGFHYCYPSFS
jgi:uncharacterized protein (TIGR01777 family)